MLWEVEGIKQSTPEKDLVGLCLLQNDMESLGLSLKDARMHNSGINGEGELREQPAELTWVHLEKWPLKWSVCVCVCRLPSRLADKFTASLAQIAA